MKTETLPQLLSRADATAPPPPTSPADLASAIRSRSARRSKTRRAAAASLVTVTAIVLLVMHQPTPHPALAPTIDVAQLRAEIATLDADARIHMNTARAIEHATATRHPTTDPLLASDPLARFQEQREVTAAILLHQADKLERNPATKNLARQELRRAATLFSDTAGGQRARSFLSQGT